jgi:hypothetical protein
VPDDPFDTLDEDLERPEADPILNDILQNAHNPNPTGHRFSGETRR